MTLENIVNLQREYGFTNVTKDVSYRKASLERLLEALIDNEQALYYALYNDLGKSRYETYLTEISQVKDEINFAIDHIENWTRVRKHRTPFKFWPAKSYEIKEPYGVALIISPWSHPISLTLIPLVGAIAAGNTAIIKCSKKCVNTCEAITSLINSTFDKRYIYAIDEPLSYNEIMSQKYDYIFFTGSERVGKNIVRSSATNLTPMTLELGGKCPCIIGPNADLQMAAKKIIWGKVINSGQSCIAPDYVVIPKYLKSDFIRYAKDAIAEMVRDPFNSDTYPGIINLHHFMRLTKFIMGEKNLIGGRYDDKKLIVEPTILTQVTFESEIMKEEIFGPLLPLIEYDDIYDVVDIIKRRPKPLACYIFSDNKEFVERTIDDLSFGSCCVNDVMLQTRNPRMAYGGVGGKYHGKYGFDTFSNIKSVMSNYSKADSKLKYPPFTEEKLEALKKILK